MSLLHLAIEPKQTVLALTFIYLKGSGTITENIKVQKSRFAKITRWLSLLFLSLTLRWLKIVRPSYLWASVTARGDEDANEVNSEYSLISFINERN